MNFYRLSLGFSLACHKLTRLSRGSRVMKFVVTRLRQTCDKLVTNMTLWTQRCSELMKLLHGCNEVVTKLQGSLGSVGSCC